MSRLQFVSLVRQTTPGGEKDFFFNGKEWVVMPPEPESLSTGSMLPAPANPASATPPTPDNPPINSER